MINYKVFGSLKNAMGDTVLKVSPMVSREADVLGANFNIGGSVGYASIIFMQNKAYTKYNVVHIQPSHVKFVSFGREYCTRCIYEFPIDDFEIIGYSFRSLFARIPRMEMCESANYNAEEILFESSKSDLPSLSNEEWDLMDSLLISIEQGRQLYVRIGNPDDDAMYAENGIFDSKKFQSLLKVLDYLPETERRDMSIAFSVNHVVASYINNVKIVFYQDELTDWNLDANKIISIDWRESDVISLDEKIEFDARITYKEKLSKSVNDFKTLAYIIEAWGVPDDIGKIIDRIVSVVSIEYLTGIVDLPKSLFKYKVDIEKCIEEHRNNTDKIRLLNSSVFSVSISSIKIDSWDCLLGVCESLQKYHKQKWKGLLSEILKTKEPWNWEYSSCLEILCINIMDVFSENMVSEIRNKFLVKNFIDGSYACFYSQGYSEKDWKLLLKDRSKNVRDKAVEKLLSQDKPIINVFGDDYKRVLDDYVSSYINAIRNEKSISSIFEIVQKMQSLKLGDFLSEKFDGTLLNNIKAYEPNDEVNGIKNEKIRKIIEDKNEKLRINSLPDKQEFIELLKLKRMDSVFIKSAEDIRRILNDKRSDNPVEIRVFCKFVVSVSSMIYGKHKLFFAPLDSFFNNVYSEVINWLMNYEAEPKEPCVWIDMNRIKEEPVGDVSDLFKMALGDNKNYVYEEWVSILSGYRTFVIDYCNKNIRKGDPLSLNKGEAFYDLNVVLAKKIKRYNNLQSTNDNKNEIDVSTFLDVNISGSWRKPILISSLSIVGVIIVFVFSCWIIIYNTQCSYSINKGMVDYSCNFDCYASSNHPITAIASVVCDSSYKDTIGVLNIYERSKYTITANEVKPIFPFLKRYVKCNQTKDSISITLLDSIQYNNIEEVWKLDSIFYTQGLIVEDVDYLVCKTSISKNRWNRQMKTDSILVSDKSPLLRFFVDNDSLLFNADSVFYKDSLLFVKIKNTDNTAMAYFSCVLR